MGMHRELFTLFHFLRCEVRHEGLDLLGHPIDNDWNLSKEYASSEVGLCDRVLVGVVGIGRGP